MNQDNALTIKKEAVDPRLLYELERGINDLETGRELPLKEAMEKVDEIRRRRGQFRA